MIPMTIKRFLTISALSSSLFLAPTAYAKIYQCEDEDGRTVFSDQPCKNGVSKEIEQMETILEAFVSGRITQDDNGFPLRHGIALWNRETKEMKLILTKNQLSATHIEQAIIDDWTFLEEHKSEGLGEVILFFKSAKPSFKQLRAMRSSFYGLTPETVEKPLIKNHGGNDVIGHVHKLEVHKEDQTRWVSFASQEMTPEIRWNINLILPISE